MIKPISEVPPSLFPRPRLPPLRRVASHVGRFLRLWGYPVTLAGPAGLRPGARRARARGRRGSTALYRRILDMRWTKRAKNGAPKGNRTPVFAVRGRRPGPLDDG